MRMKESPDSYWEKTRAMKQKQGPILIFRVSVSPESYPIGVKLISSELTCMY